MVYLIGRAKRDFHSITEFRQRSAGNSRASSSRSSSSAVKPGWWRLGHVSLDGTKVRANASKHKAMLRPDAPEGTAAGGRGRASGRRRDKAHGPQDDGWSLPDELKDTSRQLEKIRRVKARLEELFRDKADEKGKDPDEARVPEREVGQMATPAELISAWSRAWPCCCP